MSRPLHRLDVVALKEGRWSAETRELVREEPLLILLGDTPAATLMRTPGQERELVLGFLLSEGLIRSPADVGALAFCEDPLVGGENQVRVTLVPEAKARLPEISHRHVLSSCGVCGAKAIDAVAQSVKPFLRPAGRLSVGDVFRACQLMSESQEVFRHTGGAHAVALAPIPLTSPSDTIVREDLGRHNALDKAIGAAALAGRALDQYLLFSSGRLSYEMVAKAARAGVSHLASVSAPTSLAVATARRLNMFLAGFVRGTAMTVYCGAEALRRDTP